MSSREREHELTREVVEQLEDKIVAALEADDYVQASEFVHELEAADVADVIERLDDDARLKLFEILTPDESIDVLHELGTEAIRDLFEMLPAERVGYLLDLMPMDDAARILTRDVPERQDELLAEMQPEDAREVRELLQYEAWHAGRMMTERFVRVRPEMTIAETLAYLRQVDSEVETVSDLYALDADGVLVGVVSLREVLRSAPEQRIADVMATDVIAIEPEMDREDAARLFSRYDFLAMPVALPDGRMLGIITVDDIIHVLVEESTDDQLKFGGVNESYNQPYFTVPILRVIQTRIGWLLLLFLGGTLTGSVLSVFEGELQEVVALTLFIPLLIGTGGNTGAQTVSTIIRALALREVRPHDVVRVIGRELVMGLLLGLLLGMVALARTLLWGGLDLRFALVVGLSVLGICTWSNTISSVIPLVAERFDIDPALVSAPLITTLVDATGLAIYLLIAKAILGI